MKRLFALLLLLNIGLWMWGTWYKGNGEEVRHPLPPINANAIRLLNEPGVVLTPRPTAQPQTGPLAPVQATAVSPVCFTAGPFISADAAASTATRLVGAHWSATPRAEEERVESAYRVFLPPYATARAAETKRRELSRIGIKDHYLIQETDKKNAISLGVFSTQEAANKLLRELQVKGVRAQVETLHRTETHYWLDGQAPSAGALQQWQWGDAKATPKACTNMPSKTVSPP